jgi:cysteine desulfurase
MANIIDLDSNATTRMDGRVLGQMIRVARREWGNPASDNRLGYRSRQCIEEARQRVASLVGADSDEILFTPGATSAINVGIRGFLGGLNSGRGHILTTRVEHKAVMANIERASIELGLEVTALETDQDGRVSPEKCRDALRVDTVLVCIIHGNNEIGSLNPIAEIGGVLADHPAAYFVDAPQTIGYDPPNVRESRIDLLSMSAHKMHGPQGVGALFVRRGMSLRGLLSGGGQERGLFPGTLNVAGIAGMGVAAELAIQEGVSRREYVSNLRERFWGIISGGIEGARLNGHPCLRLPSNLNITIPYVPAQLLQRKLPHLAFSCSSACTSLSGEPSHVLSAIGLSSSEIHWTFRIGISKQNTIEEIERAASQIVDAVRQLRG